MVVVGLGTNTPTSCASLPRPRHVQTWSHQIPLLRWGLNVHLKRRFPSSGDLHATAVKPFVSREAYALVFDIAAVPGADLRSADLNDMCTLQLGMLYQLLSRAGTNYSTMRCTVYARNFTAVGPGQVKLVRVAQFPVEPGKGEDFPTQQQLLLHTEQSWALQGGSAAVDPSAMIEDCLLHREVVALPSSSSLVFPLVDCGVLVGLLVVELQTERRREAAGKSGESDGGAAEPTEMVGQNGNSATLIAASLDRGSRPHRSLTDDELQCLRLAVPLLAKACGMDARASWQLAQSSASAATARGLLREVQRPLSTLNTFGKMLVPRLKDGDPDKDMAKGILVQGKRLQDLIWQLEDALHGPAIPNSTAGVGSSSVHAPSLSVSVPGSVAALTAPPFCGSSALPCDPSPAVQELLSLPPPRPTALPSAGSSEQQQHVSAPASASALFLDAPVEGSLQYRSMDAAAGPSELESSSPRFDGSKGPAAVSPGKVRFVGRSSILPSDGAEAFTIRQEPVSAHSGQSLASGSGRSASSIRPGRRLGSGSPASTATIDVEMDRCSTSTSTINGSSTCNKAGLTRSERSRGRGQYVRSTGGSTDVSWSWGRTQVHSGGVHTAATAAAVVSTNLAAALAGVLTAAYRLAAVSGIGFIVNSPLSAVLPRRPGAASGGGKPQSAPGAPSTSPMMDSCSGAVSSTDSHQELLVKVAGRGGDDASSAAAGSGLIPRPTRPLLVGVPAALVQKMVGYMLDIALQCTPRDGQVCVSARQDGGGVQVQVLHSGRMDLQRLHVRSRSILSATAYAPAVTARTGVTLPMVPQPSDGKGASGPAPDSSGSGGGAQVGSGVLSVEMAQEMALQAGGHLTVSYPFNMVNARSGSLDIGTSVEIWLPGPGALN